MTTYRVTYHRPYLPHPERDEAQRETIVATSEAQVYNLFADCEVTHIEAVDETARVNAELATLTPTTTEADAKAVHNYIVAAEAGDTAALQYGDYDLGTRHIISGGEVMELDGHLESSYEERYEEDMPF